jgi:hypothetical protein
VNLIKPIAPEETEISGGWMMTQDGVVVDGSCQRIHDLVKSHLVKLGHDSSGWDTLYRNAADGRLWELTYPHSEMHGGGPPQLRWLSSEEAKRKYGKAVF